MMILVLSIVIWAFVRHTERKSGNFVIQQNKSIHFNAYSIETYNDISMLKCAAQCQYNERCRQLSYNTTSRICLLDVSDQCCQQTEDAPGSIVIKPVTTCECCDLPEGSVSGIYTVHPRILENVEVYCDTATDGEKWVIIQRRVDGTTDFYRNWTEYKRGFGKVDHEFWLGNNNIYVLTSRASYQLRVELEDWDNVTRYALYDVFKLGDEASNYTLTVHYNSGNAGDSLSSHNGMKFSTLDRDNDIYSGKCTDSRRGAWWYKACHNSNLNGKYQPGVTSYASISWKTFRGETYSLKRPVIKIKRVI